MREREREEKLIFFRLKLNRIFSLFLATLFFCTFLREEKIYIEKVRITLETYENFPPFNSIQYFQCP